MAGSSIRDLGELKGPLVVFGGACSNRHATKALLAGAAAQGVDGARLVFTGDALGYCAEPRETWRLLAGSGAAMIAGNVERQIAADSENCGCGFEAGSTCDRLSAGWYALARNAADEAMRNSMAGLPDWLVFTHAGRRCAVVHGGASDIARFVWPDAPEATLAAEIALIEAQAGHVDRVFAGHCGMAFTRMVGAREWINAGAIGLPPHDGAPQTRFVHVGAGGEVEIRRLDYDHAAAARAMREAGLVQGYERTLETGWWPSEDILPPGLRRIPPAA